MKLFKRLIVAFLAFSLICCPLRTSAISDNAVVTDSKQQEIDALFTELNELALQERMLQVKQEKGISTAAANNAIQLESINSRQAALKSQLEKLGVHTIDPNNPADMAQLEEVVLGSMNTNSTASIPNPPNLSSIANCYSLSQYNGTTTVNGVVYNYSYIYVTDDKEYSRSPLTIFNQQNILVGGESTVLRDLLAYNFSFLLSSYLGTTPSGWALSWTLGNIFEGLDSYDDDSVVSVRGNSGIYHMVMGSVTQMMYCYVYIPNSGWVLCGVKAPNISYARMEYMAANIDGQPFVKPKPYSDVTSSTGISAVLYARNYINGSGCDTDRIGSFRINTYGGNYVRFTPGFAELPGHLI